MQLRDPLDDETTAHAKAQADRVYDVLDDLWVDDRGIYALRECDEADEDEGLDAGPPDVNASSPAVVSPSSPAVRDSSNRTRRSRPSKSNSL